MEISSTSWYIEDDCKMMRAISSSPILLSVLFSQTTMAFISLPFLVVAIRDISRISLIHKNTKTILIFYISGLIVHSLSRITLHTTDLVNFLSPHDSDCSIFPTVLRCFLMRAPLNISVFFTCTSTIAIALERLISTCKAKTYECNRSVGFLLIGLQFVITAILAGIAYSGLNLNTNQKPFYCHATSSRNPIRSIVPVCLLIILQFSAMIILKLTERANWKKCNEQKLNPNLTVRYNVGENLRTITIVIPFCFVCCAFASITLAIICIILFFNYLFEKAIYFAIVEGILMLPLYGIALPMLIRCMNRQVNEKNISEFQHHMTHSKGKNVSSHYFNLLSKSWKGEL